ASNSGSSVYHLPSEIMANVFDLITEGDVASAILLSHVNHRWRDIALKMPSLWRTVDVLPCKGERIQALLQRSGSSLIDVRLLPSTWGPRPSRYLRMKAKLEVN